MSITEDEARSVLRTKGLRATPPRLAVLRVLSEATSPLSNSEVSGRLGDNHWDPATIYRNLIKLREAGLASVVSRAEGVNRYVLDPAYGDGHRHPHFVCEDCGRLECLPAELTASMSMEGPWSLSLKKAMVQLRGECPDCLQRGAPGTH